MKKKTLLSLQIKTEADVVLARRRARQLALLLGFEAQDQTRISTAVSEIARNAFVHANGGRVDFCIADASKPYSMVICLQDKGAGIANLDDILEGRTEHVGLLGASRLIDKFTVENLEGGGTIVQLEKEMRERQKSFSDAEMNELASSLTKLVALNPIDEVHQQNQELLAALEQLSQKQIELDRANNELAQMNQSLSEVNQQMLTLNDSLDWKVKTRTEELTLTNSDLSLARDEAVLANKLKSQFVANISHEIRTPMSGILGATELVLSNEKLDEEDHSLIKMAHESAKGLLDIISDLLDFAKLEAGKPKLQENDFYPVSVVDEVVESITTAANKKHLSIVESIDAELSGKLLSGDAVLIKRALLNITHNAVKFTPSGEIKISVDILERNDELLSVKWAVSDTGIGIAEADKSRLFQPFVQADGSNTRRYGGTGLGLSISNGYVELMNGTMSFVSEKGKGSEFWFVVPLRVV